MDHHFLSRTQDTRSRTDVYLRLSSLSRCCKRPSPPRAR